MPHRADDGCRGGRAFGAGQPHCAGGQIDGRSAVSRRKTLSMSRPAAAMAKEAINRAFETPLSEGMNVERTIPLDLRPGRSRRRHGCLHREAQAGEQEPLRLVLDVAAVGGWAKARLRRAHSNGGQCLPPRGNSLDPALTSAALTSARKARSDISGRRGRAAPGIPDRRHRASGKTLPQHSRQLQRRPLRLL